MDTDEDRYGYADAEASRAQGVEEGLQGRIKTNEDNLRLLVNNYSEKFQVVDMSSAFNAIKQDTGVTIHGILGNSFFENYGYLS